MNKRAPVIAATAALALAMLGSAAWWQMRPMLGPQDEDMADPPSPDSGTPLPLPPLPPRIAEGAKYEQCLGMLGTDPDGASTMAEVWQAEGGGDGAAHCKALAEISLGNPDLGAALLEQLAAASHAPAIARAAVYGQADQAWMMAGRPDRAFTAGTAALALSGGVPDLLIDHAMAAMALARFADAVADLDTALEADPRRADALVLRAAAWRQLDRLDRAEADIALAFDQDAENPEALLERGILRERRGDRAGAQADWARAASLSPDTPTADLAQQNLALLEAGPERR
jgi:tetratricopeptide (TPR) repeat protein